MSSAEIHLTFILHFGLWIRAVAALMLFWPLAKAGWARLQQQCISNCAAPIGVKRHSLRWTAMGSEKCTWPCPALSEVASLSLHATIFSLALFPSDNLAAFSTFVHPQVS